MSHTVESLAAAPNSLAPHYRRFRVAERLLLTGHSHQAWPDVGFEGQREAWLEAAERVDEKWEGAFRRRDRVRRGYAELLGDHDGSFTLAPSTHDLVVRFLSGLPLRERPRLVTTDAEFHSIRRQVDRLAEEGLELVKVPGRPATDVAGRLAREVDARTACVLVSAVTFERAHVVPGLGEAARACARHGAELLVDGYHALGAVPFRLAEEGLEGAFVVGGGYKYLQLGEGNCFLRAPPGCRMRPVVTGWFAEFGELSAERDEGGVRYASGPARFAGSTYDPTPHYRASRVLDFFEREGLTPELLRRVNRHQVGLLIETFRSLDLDPGLVCLDDGVGPEGRGGFLALEASDAEGLSAALRTRGVRTDHRGSLLRFGPAPYLHDGQLVDAMEALGEAVRERETG